jgi:hypothetical protein
MVPVTEFAEHIETVKNMLSVILGYIETFVIPYAVWLVEVIQFLSFRSPIPN